MTNHLSKQLWLPREDASQQDLDENVLSEEPVLHQSGGRVKISLLERKKKRPTATLVKPANPQTATSHREYAALSGLYLSHVLIGKSAARALGQAR
jgi:hypothetical protein